MKMNKCSRSLFARLMLTLVLGSGVLAGILVRLGHAEAEGSPSALQSSSGLRDYLAIGPQAPEKITGPDSGSLSEQIAEQKPQRLNNGPKPRFLEELDPGMIEQWKEIFEAFTGQPEGLAAQRSICQSIKNLKSDDPQDSSDMVWEVYNLMNPFSIDDGFQLDRSVENVNKIKDAFANICATPMAGFRVELNFFPCFFDPSEMHEVEVYKIDSEKLILNHVFASDSDLNCNMESTNEYYLTYGPGLSRSVVNNWPSTCSHLAGLGFAETGQCEETPEPHNYIFETNPQLDFGKVLEAQTKFSDWYNKFVGEYKLITNTPEQIDNYFFRFGSQLICLQESQDKVEEAMNKFFIEPGFQPIVTFSTDLNSVAKKVSEILKFIPYQTEMNVVDENLEALWQAGTIRLPNSEQEAYELSGLSHLQQFSARLYSGLASLEKARKGVKSLINASSDKIADFNGKPQADLMLMMASYWFKQNTLATNDPSLIKFNNWSKSGESNPIDTDALNSYFENNSGGIGQENFAELMADAKNDNPNKEAISLTSSTGQSSDGTMEFTTFQKGLKTKFLNYYSSFLLRVPEHKVFTKEFIEYMLYDVTPFYDIYLPFKVCERPQFKDVTQKSSQEKNPEYIQQNEYEVDSSLGLEQRLDGLKTALANSLTKLKTFEKSCIELKIPKQTTGKPQGSRLPLLNKMRIINQEQFQQSSGLPGSQDNLDQFGNLNTESPQIQNDSLTETKPRLKIINLRRQGPNQPFPSGMNLGGKLSFTNGKRIILPNSKRPFLRLRKQTTGVTSEECTEFNRSKEASTKYIETLVTILNNYENKKKAWSNLIQKEPKMDSTQTPEDNIQEDDSFWEESVKLEKPGPICYPYSFSFYLFDILKAFETKPEKMVINWLFMAEADKDYEDQEFDLLPDKPLTPPEPSNLILDYRGIPKTFGAYNNFLNDFLTIVFGQTPQDFVRSSIDMQGHSESQRLLRSLRQSK